MKTAVLTTALCIAMVALESGNAREVVAGEFPPGWRPISKLDDRPTWKEFREIDDRIHLYLPSEDESVRGVFVCFVFHSGDPRELARLWKFALVTVPWPFEYDLGVNDKRNGRYKLGHPVGDMGVLLRYLQHAARQTGRPELATVPLVGWLGQNGSRLCADLYERAPERVLAWSDSFPNRLRQQPELTKSVPFAFAWEISKDELRNRQRRDDADDQPLADLSCRANTYGFDHGIYSKFNFFMTYLDRCIRLRMPDNMPAPGQPVPLKSVTREQGWLGDFHLVSEWNPIAAADSPEARHMQYPCWLPDQYAAWMWRSYHSADPGLKLTGPVIEYGKYNGQWGGPQCGLGYGGYLPASEPLTFSASTSGEYDKVEFRAGDRLIGVATQAPWKLEGVRLEAGLHALFAVGVHGDGLRTASRPAFAIVRGSDAVSCDNSGWPSYRGQNGQFADTSGVRLIDDMTRVKLLWESEETQIGFGKTDTGYGRHMSHFGDLMPAGIASPILAEGLVIVSYAHPSGEVIDEANKANLTPENWQRFKHKARVGADDVVIGIDAETGKTRWKRVFEGQGRNPGTGKRNLSGMTPVAADDKVFAMGTCGALYALDLATGEVIWKKPNWPNLEAARDVALARGGPAGAPCPTGWLMMVDGVLVVPISAAISPARGGTARGVDPADGTTLWEAPVHPNTLAPGVVDGKACLLSPRIAIVARTGEVLWRNDHRPNYARPLVFGEKLLIGFEPHPDGEALLQAKEGNTRKGAHSFGVLAGYSVDEKGATVKWTLPRQYQLWMQPDSGGFPCLAARNGLIYHLADYQEKADDHKEKRLLVIRESDGTILASQSARGEHLYLWGDRAIVATDINHRPRAANAEVWQMFDADPANLRPLGKGWHINGNPPVHVATGGYELPTLEAFANGIGFFRVAGGIRAYDLRRPRQP